MNPLRPRSFSAKLMLLVSLTSGAMAAMVCAVLVLMNYGRAQAMAIDNVHSLARTIAVHAGSTIDFNDREAARETLEALREVPQVARAILFDMERQPFATYRRSGGDLSPPSFAQITLGSQVVDGWLVYTVPVNQEEDRRVGTLQLVYDMAQITQRLQRDVMLSLLASLLAMAVGLFIAGRLQRVITRPIGELVATARQISEQRSFNIRARKVSQDELGDFTDEFNDMLEKLQHQDELLQAAHQRFRTAVEAAPNAMVMVDERGHILLVNRQTEQMFGYAREALIGNSIEALVPEWNREIQSNDRDDVFRESTARAIDARPELLARRRDGSEFPVEIGLNPIRTDEGGRILSSIVDITERRRAEQERADLLKRERAAREEAERANRIKDEFLATLSHELRTPMTAILGWAQMLKAGKTGNDLETGLEIIERNARTQSQIIEDLLDMSRIISGKVRLDVQQVNLPEVINAALATVAPAAEARGIRLQAVLDPHAAPVKGDPNRLQQVMWNLISNAIKFTPRGGRVQIALQRINSHVEVSVSDTGQGIAAEFLPHVFERFRQADATTTRPHGGLGLGLAIVKQLIELHGGSVRAQSPGEGQGSTFIVALPLAVVHAQRSEADVHPRIQRPDALPGEELSLSGVKVLVVDDEPDARDLISRLLEKRGARVNRAASASEAFDHISSCLPDVIVSDIGMPTCDGYDFIRQVRSRSAGQGGAIPAIALTAFARSEDRTRSLLAGYQLHLAKPVEPSELIASVATLAGPDSASGHEKEPGGDGRGT